MIIVWRRRSWRLSHRRMFSVMLSNAHKIATVQAYTKLRLIMKASTLLCDGVAPDLSQLSKAPILAPLLNSIGMFVYCCVGDDVLVGVSAVREVYVMVKANGDRAMNKDRGLLKLFDFFVLQDIR